MATHPGLPPIALVAAFRDDVKVVVGGVEEVDSARVRRVRMEDPPIVPGEDAETLPIGIARSQRSVVVDLVFLLLRRERGAVVEVELRLARRDPVEPPPHPLPVRLELLERR